MAPESGDEAPDLAQRLLAALYAQKTELGEVATELISLLTAAGVSLPAGTVSRSGSSPPG
jgi:hypothetical protein